MSFCGSYLNLFAFILSPEVLLARHFWINNIYYAIIEQLLKDNVIKLCHCFSFGSGPCVTCWQGCVVLLAECVPIRFIRVQCWASWWSDTEERTAHIFFTRMKRRQCLCCVRLRLVFVHCPLFSTHPIYAANPCCKLRRSGTFEPSPMELTFESSACTVPNGPGQVKRNGW